MIQYRATVITNDAVDDNGNRDSRNDMKNGALVFRNATTCRETASAIEINVGAQVLCSTRVFVGRSYLDFDTLDLYQVRAELMRVTSTIDYEINGRKPRSVAAE